MQDLLPCGAILCICTLAYGLSTTAPSDDSLPRKELSLYEYYSPFDMYLPKKNLISVPMSKMVRHLQNAVAALCAKVKLTWRQSKNIVRQPAGKIHNDFDTLGLVNATEPGTAYGLLLLSTLTRRNHLI